MRKIVNALVLLSPLAAHATLPATHEQRLCIGGAPDIVVAIVQDGKGADCRLGITEEQQCEPMNIVRLSIKMGVVLAVSKDRQPPGEDTALSGTYDSIQNDVGRTVEIETSVADSDDDGDLVGPTSEPLTDKRVKKLFVGKEFIFSIMPTGALDGHHWATVWPMKSKPWVMKTLREADGAGCPLPYDRRHRFG